MKVGIKRLHKDANIPKYAYEGDAGFDLAAIESVTLSPGETKLIGTGLAFNIPSGYELQVRPRSGMSLKTKLRVANAPGTVDSNFKGEVKVIAENTGHRPIFIEKGDRIAQAVLGIVFTAEFVEEELNDSERGEKGFGSSN